MDTLKALNRERGVTIVMVTHESDIARYVDRTVTMRDGRIVSDERRAAPALVARPSASAERRCHPMSRELPLATT